MWSRRRQKTAKLTRPTSPGSSFRLTVKERECLHASEGRSLLVVSHTTILSLRSVQREVSLVQFHRRLVCLVGVVGNVYQFQQWLLCRHVGARDGNVYWSTFLLLLSEHVRVRFIGYVCGKYFLLTTNSRRNSVTVTPVLDYSYGSLL